MVRVTVSGSFHRHIQAIYQAVGQLRAAGANVLSPSDPRVVDHLGDFLFVASDRLRSVKLVQDRHLAAIRASAFLWVVCPDGYTGPSTSMEIGAANALDVPIFSADKPLDITMRNYIQTVGCVQDAIEHVGRRKDVESLTLENVLLDPSASIDASVSMLEQLRPVLLGISGNGTTDPERRLSSTRNGLSRIFRIR